MEKPSFFPIGTRVQGSRGEFRIRILYREPTYARVAAAQGRDYRWTYRIRANDVDQAIAMAKREFRKMERLSSVGWAREITEIFVVE